MESINVVLVQGNLTKDPELRNLPSGNSVCKMRIAVNGRIKDRDSGEWRDKPNFFDVTVWGKQGENCAQYLQRGSGLVVNGRLDWREWEAEGGGKRQAVEIVAEQVRFMGENPNKGSGGSGGGSVPDGPRAPSIGEDDDIPF